MAEPTTYSGLAVGGPAHGEQLVSRSRFYRVAVLPEGFAYPKAGEVSSPPSVNIVEYVWREGRWHVNAH